MVDLAVDGLGAGKLIGGGASASVFVATRLSIGDRVAVKVLKQTLTDEQSRSHFEREARALAELADIPGVVAVLDSGINIRGEPYLVFPLFQGSAQGDVSAKGAMEPIRAARMVAAAARAVHQGHLRGVIHRDLKPANLLLTNSDDIFVSDFGIAKLTDSSVSASGWLGLTPAYAPPEALEGIPAGVLGDVYSLGATLAALIIGSPPFSSTGAESPIALLNRVVNEPAPDLQKNGASAAIAAASFRAMSKDSSARFQTALDLAIALEEAADAESPGGIASSLSVPVPGLSSPPPPVAAAPPSVPVSPSVSPPPVPAAPHPAPTAPAPPPAPILPTPIPAAPIPAAPTPVPSRTPTARPIPAVAGTPAAPPPVLATNNPPSSGATPPPATPFTPVSQPIGEDGSGAGKKKLALAAGLVVAVAAIIGGLFAFGGSDPTDLVEPTAIVRPTPEPSSTGPTATAIEPEASPTPAATPLPSAVPTVAFVVGGPLDVNPDGTGEAVDLAEAVDRAQDGDVIRLAAGRYELDRAVRITNDITIVGAGQGETILVGTGERSALFFDGTSGGLQDLTVTSTFEAPEDDTVGLVEFNGAESMRVDHVTLTNGTGFGLAAIDSTGWITNSLFDEHRLTAVGIGGASNVEIANSSASRNGESGFGVYDTSQALLLNNTATNNGQFGFSIQNSGTVSLAGNSSTGNDLSGFTMAGESTSDLVGNRASGNGEAGFVWFDSAAGTAVANEATDNVFNGFSINASAAPTLTGNTSNENNDSGYSWAASASGSAVGNRADANGINGFRASDESTVALRANFGTDNVQDLFVIVATGATLDESGVVLVEADGSGDVPDLAAAISAASDGDVIRLGAGLFLLENSIEVNTDITLIGEGPLSSTVSVSGESTAFLVEGTPFRIRNLAITSTFSTDSDDDRFSLVELDRSEFVVDNVSISDSVGVGLSLFAADGTITNSTFSTSYWSGLGIAESSDAIVASNVFVSNGQSGLVFFDDSTGTVGGNTATGNETVGISVQGSSTARLVGNTATGNTVSGFVVAQEAAPLVAGNMSSDNQEAGFTWFNEAKGVAIANHATGNATSGFVVSDSAAPMVNTNRATSNQVDGFTWFEAGGGSANGNLATENTFDGFAAEDDSTPTLERNTARKNGRRAFNQSDSATPTLNNNEFG